MNKSYLNLQDDIKVSGIDRNGTKFNKKITANTNVALVVGTIGIISFGVICAYIITSTNTPVEIKTTMVALVKELAHKFANNEIEGIKPIVDLTNTCLNYDAAIA